MARCSANITARRRSWSYWGSWVALSMAKTGSFVAAGFAARYRTSRTIDFTANNVSPRRVRPRRSGQRFHSALPREQPHPLAPSVAGEGISNSPLHRPWFRIYYNDVYEVRLPPNHRFPMEKYRLVRERLQAKVRSDRGANRTSGVHCEFVVSPLATVEELATTHDPRYIDRFVRGVQTPVEIRNVGFPWSPQGVERALSSAGGTVAAACAAVEESLKRRSLLRSEPSSTSSSSTSSRSRRVPPCWAAHVAGGTHHAFHDHGEGFCVFSDIAVAANVVRGRYEEHVRSILVLDLDVHQGNGNAVLFRDRDDVFTFSMHCSSNYFSPKQQSDLDIELPAGCTDETYLITLHHWLQKLRKERTFDLVFYQAGVDVLECDRLGQLSLSSRGVERRNQLVYDLCLDLDVPLVITMGGGYPKHGGPWDPIIDAHCAVYWQAHQALANLSLPSDASTRPSL